MKNTWFMAAGLATVLAASATAQEGPYIKGAVGSGVFEDVTSERTGISGEVNPEGDARFMLGGGYAFANGWRLDVDAVDRYADGGAVNSNTFSSTDIQNVTLSVNAIRDFNRAGRLNPYLGAGIGASRTNFSLAGNFGGPIDSEAQETGAAFQGLAGLAFKLSDRLSADVEYRYVDLPDVEGPGFEASDLVSHDVLFGLRYALSGPAPAPRAAPPAPPTQAAAPVAATCEAVDFVVYFEWDASDLTSQAAQTVAAAADQAASCTITRVNIEGHADRSGAASYNVALSERRARVVRDELVRRGVGASMIPIEALGESQPAVDTPDGAREPLNRRSEVVISVAGSTS